MKKSLVKYSPQEQRMLALLTRRPQNTAVLREKFFAGKPPFHARPAVIAVLSNLARKVEENREPFRIKQTPRAGPLPSSFWIEKRQ